VRVYANCLPFAFAAAAAAAALAVALPAKGFNTVAPKLLAPLASEAIPALAPLLAALPYIPIFMSSAAVSLPVILGRGFPQTIHLSFSCLFFFMPHLSHAHTATVSGTIGASPTLTFADLWWLSFFFGMASILFSPPTTKAKAHGNNDFVGMRWMAGRRGEQERSMWSALAFAGGSYLRRVSSVVVLGSLADFADAVASQAPKTNVSYTFSNLNPIDGNLSGKLPINIRQQKGVMVTVPSGSRDDAQLIINYRYNHWGCLGLFDVRNGSTLSLNRVTIDSACVDSVERRQVPSLLGLGTAIVALNATILLRDSVFSNGLNLHDSGGSIYGDTMLMRAHNTTWHHNQCEQQGGALMLRCSDVAIYDSNFTQQFETLGSGGAIYFDTISYPPLSLCDQKTTKLVVQNSVFDTNQAGQSLTVPFVLYVCQHYGNVLMFQAELEGRSMCSQQTTTPTPSVPLTSMAKNMAMVEMVVEESL
jgi:hypothetical protein